MGLRCISGSSFCSQRLRTQPGGFSRLCFVELPPRVSSGGQEPRTAGQAGLSWAPTSLSLLGAHGSSIPRAGVHKYHRSLSSVCWEAASSTLCLHPKVSSGPSDTTGPPPEPDPDPNHSLISVTGVFFVQKPHAPSQRGAVCARAGESLPELCRQHVC